MTNSWRRLVSRCFLRRRRRVLGVAFGSEAAKLAEVSVDGEAAVLLGAAAASLQLEGGEAWEDACASQLSETVKRMGMRPDAVVASLPETRLSAARLALPALSERELAQAVRWEAARRVPWEAGTYYWDYAAACEVETCRVWLLAARRDDVEALARVFRKASLPLAAVESERLALGRLLPQGLALDIARSESRLLAFARGALQEQQAVAVGGDAFTEAAREALGVSLEEAEAVKPRVSCSEPRIAAQMNAAAQRLAQAVGAVAGVRQETLFLLGGGACLDGLAEALALQRLEARPLLGELCDAVRLSSDVSRRDAARFAGAAALCLRGNAV